MLISIKSFSGEIPRIGNTLLNTSQAQYALNTKLWSGELRCRFEDSSVEEIEDAPSSGNTYQTLYYYERPGDDSIWLRWAESLSLAKGPVANDTYNRVYVTGLDVPRVFDSSMVTDTTTTIDDSTSYALAIPQPDPGLISVSGASGGGSAEARTYTLTYGREWSDYKFDEGQAALPAETAGGSFMTVDVELGQVVNFTFDGPDVARTDVTHITIYRSATGSEETNYLFVERFNIADAIAGSVPSVTYLGSNSFVYNDVTLTDELGEALTTIDWTAPEDTLSGIVSLNNGVMAGYIDNIVSFSEPYQPHAWPEMYKVTLDYPIVGLGYFGNTVVACTTAYPVMLTVSDPAAVIITPINEIAPCSSRESIVNASDSVFYASASGLIQISADGILLASQQLFSKDDWFAYNPSSFKSVLYEGKLLTFYTTLLGEYGSFIIDMAEANASVNRINGLIESFYIDPQTDKLYYIYAPVGLNRYVWQWEGIPGLNRTMVWKSKKFVSPEGPISLAAARVRADRTCESNLEEAQSQVAELEDAFLIPDLNGPMNEIEINSTAINGDSFEDVRVSLRVRCDTYFKLYVDGSLAFSIQVVDNKPFRLPSGIVGTEFEIEVEATTSIYQIDAATSMNELQ